MSLPLTLLVLLVACGGSQQASDGTSTPPTPTSEARAGQLPSDLHAAIIADAAAQMGVSEANAEVTSVEAKTFNDSSLDCPEEGQVYAQVLTPGFVVIVDAAETELDYRVDVGSDSFKLCQDSES